MLDLKEGDKVSLAQDEEEAANWYIYKDKDGFAVKAKDKVGTVAFNHKALSTEFKNAFEFPDVTKAFMIAGQPTTFEKTQYWGILVTNS